MPENFYDLLDVSPDASEEEIKQAFREQVRVYHPDRNDDDRARAQFTVIKKAHDVLADPEERKAYDRLGHEAYVAKRTKGLPSPSRWKTSPDDDGRWSSDATTGSTRSKGGGTATGGGDRRTTGRARSTGTASNARSDGAGGTNTGGTRAGGTTESRRHSRTRSQPGPFGDNRLVRWWRARNFAWPLLWVATVTYVAGLVHFAVRNGAALRSLASDLAAVGADPAGAVDVLTSDSHGVDSAYGHVADVEVVAPPFEPALWYAALLAIPVLALAGLVGARVAWRDDPWEPISIDETIAAGSALGVISILLGGPLLAGAVLLPILFGVVVHRTRMLPGWSPSYAYVAAVSAPAVAIAVGALGYGSVPVEFVAVWLLPLVGAFGLVLRVRVRKRFGV